MRKKENVRFLLNKILKTSVTSTINLQKQLQECLLNGNRNYDIKNKYLKNYEIPKSS